MVTDLTKGNPDKTLWKFTLPMIISVMFQQLYSTVDSIVAGQFAGVNALAAVGASYPITMLFIAVANGSNIGCSVVISQLFGWKTHYAYENGCQYLYYLISYFISYTDCSRSVIIKSAFKGNGNTG